MNLIYKTRTWLLDNNILVPDDWVTACIEWIQEEHQGAPQSQDQINSLVYEQWLLADLHELETQCLPTSVLTADKFQLTGAYALQIDSILDVGQSFYSQQQKVKGTENANVGVSAEEQQLKPWEQKPTRMLMLKLTDGSQTVQGMEYKPISCLSPQTQPGSKILVHGSVLCRHGILMLSENNIKFLGGEVDTLVAENTKLNVLESAMEASTENAGKSHRQEFEGSGIRPSQKPSIKPEGQRFGGQQMSVQQTKREKQTQGFVKQELKVKQEIPGSLAQQRTNNNIEDQWDDDQMFDALIDDMDVDDFQQTESKNSSHTRTNNSAIGPTQNQSVNSRNASGGSVGGSLTNYTTTHANGNNSCNIRNGVNSVSASKRNNSLSVSKGNMRKDLSLKSTNKEVTQRNIDSVGIKKNDFDALPAKRSRPATPDNEEMNCFEDDIDFSEINEFEEMETDMVDNKTLCQAYPDSHGSEVPVNKRNLNTNKNQTSHSVNIQPQKNAISKASVDRFISSDKNARAEMVDCKTEPEPGSEYPFTYLSKVLKERPSVTRIVTVKAYISTLTSKLSSDDGRWSLSCKINDGTLACDVDLSDKVLTDLIGFSTADAMTMKGRAKTDRSVRDILQEGIQHCQRKLIELMCLMEVDVGSKNSKPTVVALRQISPNDIQLLHNRVISSWSTLLS